MEPSAGRNGSYCKITMRNSGLCNIDSAFFSVNWIIFIITLLTVVINTILGLQTNKTQYQKREKTILHERKLDYVNRVFYQDEHLQDITWLLQRYGTIRE